MKRVRCIALLALLFAESASAAILKDSSCTGGPQTPLCSAQLSQGAGTATATFPIANGTNYKTGDQCLIIASRSNAAVTWGAPPTGWTAVTGSDVHAVTPVTIVYYKLGMGAAEPNPILQAASGTPAYIAMMTCYTGVGAVNTNATLTNFAAGTTTLSAPSLTPFSANDYLLMEYVAASSHTFSAQTPAGSTIDSLFSSTNSIANVGLQLSSAAATATGTIVISTAAAAATNGQIDLEPVGGTTSGRRRKFGNAPHFCPRCVIHHN